MKSPAKTKAKGKAKAAKPAKRRVLAGVAD